MAELYAVEHATVAWWESDPKVIPINAVEGDTLILGVTWWAGDDPPWWTLPAGWVNAIDPDNYSAHVQQENDDGPRLYPYRWVGGEPLPDDVSVGLSAAPFTDVISVFIVYLGLQAGEDIVSWHANRVVLPDPGAPVTLRGSVPADGTLVAFGEVDVRMPS